jgi:hypothetical protein
VVPAMQDNNANQVTKQTPGVSISHSHSGNTFFKDATRIWLAVRHCVLRVKLIGPLCPQDY